MIDFFNSNCQETTDEISFGIIDPQDGGRAYLMIEDTESCNAIIQNTEGITITFVAIDGCIKIKKEDDSDDSRCDGLMVYNDNIDFVELKHERKNWIPKGVKQLKHTIGLFIEGNDLDSYKRKRAFLSNSKHPRFRYSHKEEMQRFKDSTGVRLIICNEIKI